MKKSIASRVYEFGVDAVAMNLFSLIYVVNDKFVGGKDWSQAWSTRLTAAVGNTLTGRPYGLFRDWMMQKFNVKKNSHFLRKYAAETITFAIGQSPLYALYLAGGDMAPEIIEGIRNLELEQVTHAYQRINIEGMKSAVTTLTFLAPLLGMPQGWTYDKVREKCGLEKIVENPNENLAAN